ncbi:MAG: signal recognition particle-docking protein FtsY [Candidatus Binatia bacterium]
MGLGAIALAAVAVVVAAWAFLVRGRGFRAPRRLPALRKEAPWTDGLRATRRRLAESLDAVLRGGRPLDEVLEGLEEALLVTDVGMRTAQTLCGRVRARLHGRTDAGAVREALKSEVEATLDSPAPPAPSSRPWVILVTGVNGVGKTTTIGKLAALHAASGRRVLLVAADTFRAAAAEQLAIWAERAGAGLVRHEAGGTPAAVVFDGMTAARARDVDVVLIDTAGRLHTQENLMEELRKIRRVIAKELPGAPHESYLVLDATTGQNALSQARLFTDAVDLTGVILTKLDGTARGGIAIAVRSELGIPIRYVGIGEAIGDLREFDAHAFTEALLGDDGRAPLRAPLTVVEGGH